MQVVAGMEGVNLNEQSLGNTTLDLSVFLYQDRNFIFYTSYPENLEEGLDHSRCSKNN